VTLLLCFAESLHLGRPVRGLLLEISGDRDRHLHLSHPEQIPACQGCRKTNAAGKFKIALFVRIFGIALSISIRTITKEKKGILEIATFFKNISSTVPF
jgi:hypothetical protein